MGKECTIRILIYILILLCEAYISLHLMGSALLSRSTTTIAIFAGIFFAATWWALPVMGFGAFFLGHFNRKTTYPLIIIILIPVLQFVFFSVGVIEDFFQKTPLNSSVAIFVLALPLLFISMLCSAFLLGKIVKQKLHEWCYEVVVRTFPVDSIYQVFSHRICMEPSIVPVCADTKVSLK